MSDPEAAVKLIEDYYDKKSGGTTRAKYKYRAPIEELTPEERDAEYKFAVKAEDEKGTSSIAGEGRITAIAQKIINLENAKRAYDKGDPKHAELTERINILKGEAIRLGRLDRGESLRKLGEPAAAPKDARTVKLPGASGDSVERSYNAATDTHTYALVEKGGRRTEFDPAEHPELAAHADRELGTPLDTKAGQKIADTFMPGRGVKVVARAEDVPPEVRASVENQGKGAQGLYHGPSGHTYIIMGEIPTLRELFDTLSHEVVGHGGVRAVLGDKFAKFMDGVVAAKDKNKLLWTRIERSYGTDNPRNTAEEYLAHLAENPKADISTWQRAVGFIRNHLRDTFGLRVTDADIRYILQRAREETLKPTDAMNQAQGKGDTKARLRLDNADEDTKARLPLAKEATAAALTMERQAKGIRWRMFNGFNFADIDRRKNEMDNAAQRSAESTMNTVKNDLYRGTYGTADVREQFIARPWIDPHELPKAALTFAVESQGNRAELATMRDKLTNAPDPHGRSTFELKQWRDWRDFALKAVDYADAHWNELQTARAGYEEATRFQHDREVMNGVNGAYRKGYVLHAQDLEGTSKGIFGGGATGGTASGFRNARTHATYADSIAAGVSPESLDAIALGKNRLHTGEKLVTSRMWFEGFRGMTDPTDGKPLALDPVPDNNGRMVSPDIDHTVVNLFGKELAVKKGFANHVRAISDPSAFDRSLGGKMAMELATGAKHIMLVGDVYHLMRLGYWSALSGGGVGSFKKGLALERYSNAEIAKMEANGEVSPEVAQYARENRVYSDALDRAGYNTAHVEDNLHAELTQLLPGFGRFNKFLFNEFQRGAMKQAGIYETKRLMKQGQSMGEAAKNAADALNKRFGNLGAQSWIKSRTFRDFSRLLFLAPQWNEGLIRSEIGAVKDATQIFKNGNIAVPTMLKVLSSAVIGQFVANQILSLAVNGKPTWENEEEGFDAKISVKIPDLSGSSPGLFISPVAPAFETAHLIAQRMDSTGNFHDAVRQYLSSRLSAFAKPINVIWTGKDALGRSLRPEEFWKEVAKSAAPVPISGGAVVNAVRESAAKVRGNSEGTRQEIPGQYQKQMLSTLGIKAKTAPSASQQIAKMADTFNKQRAVKPAPEYFTGPYQDLSKYIRIGNTTEARAALEDLRLQKTDKQIAEHFQKLAQVPFTHAGQSQEQAFIRTLTDEQRGLYRRAAAEQRETAMKFFNLLRSTPPAARQRPGLNL